MGQFNFDLDGHDKQIQTDPLQNVHRVEFAAGCAHIGRPDRKIALVAQQTERFSESVKTMDTRVQKVDN